MLKTNTSILFVIISIWFSPDSFGQIFREKQIDISTGAGIDPTFNYQYEMRQISGNIAVNYSISDAISLGAFFTRFAANRRYSGLTMQPPGNSGNVWMEDHIWHMHLFCIQGTYHFGKIIKIKNVDLYSGLKTGYNFVNHTLRTQNPTPYSTEWVQSDYQGGFVFSVYAGCQYNFIKYVGVFAEAGYGITYYNVGMNFRITEGK